MKTFDYAAGVSVVCPLTVAGVATDPSTLSLVVRPPNGADTTYTYAAGQIVKDSVGNYHYNLIVSQSGFWDYEWTATSPSAAYRGRFYVNPPVP